MTPIFLAALRRHTVLHPQRPAPPDNAAAGIGRRLQTFRNRLGTGSRHSAGQSRRSPETGRQQLFSLQLSEAGRQLDNASFTVRERCTAIRCKNVAIAYSLTALPFCASPETTNSNCS
ncbi:MAG UNVERIFIED_CONTAM: hypothetical protein LVR18_47405 [Planctomycetaceae bacterium]